MNLEKYLQGRKPDKRRLIHKAIEKATFSIHEVVQLSQSTETYTKMGVLTRVPGDAPTVHLRLQAVVDRWTKANCHSGVIRMRSPTAWGFEDIAEAIMFKLAFV